MQRLLTLAPLLAAIVAPSPAAPDHPHLVPGQAAGALSQKWLPVKNMSDEFEGSAIDDSKWQTEPVGNGWSWYGRPPGLFVPKNARTADGNLKVTVSKLDEPVERGGNRFTHQGAIIRSLHAGQPGWFYECRMKANQTAMSSTFWLMTKANHVKKLELDIQECVGRTSDLTSPWAKKWDRIFHSNLIHRTNRHNPTKAQIQNSIPTETANWERYYVYGAWWKSPDEVRFYLDGKHVYSIEPKVEWDVPAFIQMAIETYDWNPIPADGGLVESGTEEQRTTSYDWVRVWKPADPIPAAVEAKE
ncbi:glycoside hydrolase [Haloferula helveola]|uniref:Glycoside hydrolase n=1 Tax=Haloferula helveola TaxID=490095 RepID=A0ABN6GZZ2_9BACT|nr:glycoside hydrolase [Haloferula helveola]